MPSRSQIKLSCLCGAGGFSNDLNAVSCGTGDVPRATENMAPPCTYGPLTRDQTSFILRSQTIPMLGSIMKEVEITNTQRAFRSRILTASLNRARRVISSRENRQAKRFPISVQVRFRAFGESDWSLGTTENISAAGIFFRCNQSSEIRGHVEFDFVLRIAQNEVTGTRVVCLGEIVRTEVRSNASREYTLAAKIKNYRLFPWQGSMRPC